MCLKTSGSSGNLTCGSLVSDEDSLLVCGGTKSICISAKDIPVGSRTSSVSPVIKSNSIVSVSKV